MSDAKPKILVVDDEPEQAEATVLVLEDAGYEVVLACNGNECLEKVAADRPAAIVLDVMMPVKDGFATCAELKASEEYRDIPIVLLTGVESHMRNTNYAADGVIRAEAEEYLEKPVDPDALLETIEKFLA